MADARRNRKSRQKSRVCQYRAGVAQLVEQRFCKPLVVGSNPATGSKSQPAIVIQIAKCGS